MSDPMKLEDFHCYAHRRVSSAAYAAMPDSVRAKAREQLVHALMSAALDRVGDTGLRNNEDLLFYEQTLDVYVVPPTLMYALIRDEAMAMTRFMHRYEPVPSPATDAPSTTVYVALDGGLVETAFSDRAGINVVVLDQDVDGADEDELTTVVWPSGATQRLYVTHVDVVHDAPSAEAVARALEVGDGA